jgi:hypothetical protein
MKPSRFRHLLLTLACGAAFTVAAPRASAQQAADPEAHPASKVVHEYLGMILSRQWNGSANIVDEASMEGLKADYVARIKQARTMDDEEAMVRRVGKSTLDEVEAMKPRDFYTAYHDGLQERYKVDEPTLELIRKSLSIKLLSLAQESDRLVHVLVRTKHSNGKVMIENLELVSLVKNGDKWQVALNEQAPKLTPVNGAAAPKAGPAAPAADPVKPAVKPATKPAPAAPAKNK